MKKIILLATLFLTGGIAVLAQPVAQDGKIEMQRTNKNAAVIELPYSPDVVQRAIKEYMLKNGIKEEVSKGFQIFKGARLTPTDGEVVDLYFKVERKSRRENSAVTNLIIGRPNENVALRTADDSYRSEDAKAFLNNFIPTVDAYNLEVQIDDQKNLLTKQEKKLANLQDDQRSLEKKIENLEDKLSQVKKDIEAQRAEIERQQSVQQAMEGRRVSR